MTKNVRKNKPVTVETVVITKEQRDAVETILTSTFKNNKTIQVRRVVGGSCVGCGGMPTKKITYTLEGAELVEWYCDNCYNPDVVQW